MDQLSQYLERFKKILTSSSEIKETILSVIASISGITLEKTDIDIKHDTLYIKAHPATRNAIFMRKRKVLDELSSRLGTHAPRDIR